MAENVNVDSFRRILCLELDNPGKGNVLRAVKALEKRSDVYYVGPDYILSCDSVSPRGSVLPDDPSDVGWAEDIIELTDAWQIETGSSAIKVGVLDSGIDVTHPDLQGRVNISLSRNYVNDSYSATVDPLGHGTHVAGIIGGAGNNNIGIRGVCQNITLVSLRVIDLNLVTYSSTVTEAINYAEANDIPILNLSIDAQDVGHISLFQALADYSGILVCAAGNDGIDIDIHTGVYPGSLDNENIICVGATTQGNLRHTHSNYGQVDVDLFAPGDLISSCFPKTKCSASNCLYNGHISHGYHFMSGTSMATPFVTGAAALMLSAHPNLSVSTTIALILNNAKTYASLDNLCVTEGILNVKNILNARALHTDSCYYQSVNSSRHRVNCGSCNYSILEPHAWDGAGGCLLCSY